jgi:uncharacterized damage-inducible protein DinB
MNTPLANMLRYNRWATDTLLDACRSLTDEQLDTHHAWTSGSIREVLVHLVGGQQTFALRTQGRQHEGELNRSSRWPGFEQLAAIARASGDELVSIAESLDDDADTGLTYMGRTYRYPKSFFLVHAVEHGVEHRTEIKLALAAIGVPTPDVDAWQFAAAMSYGEDVTG